MIQWLRRRKTKMRKKLLVIGILSFFIISCDNNSFSTDKKLDSLDDKIENEIDTLSNKIDDELDTLSNKIENTAGKVWDSTKAGAKDLKNRIKDKLERNRDSIKRNDSIK